MSDKFINRVLLVVFLLFIAWLLVFGQVSETDHSGEIVYRSVYIHDAIINWWNNVKPF